MPLGAARLSFLAKSSVTAVAEVIRQKIGVSANGNAQVDTAQSKFGGASAYFVAGSTDYLQLGTTTPFAFGNNDWTIEMWFRLTDVSGLAFLWDTRPLSTNGSYSTIYVNGSTLYYYRSGNKISTTVSATTWYHLAVTYDSATGDHKMWLNGTQAGSTYTETITYAASDAVIGFSTYNNNYAMDGHIDEVRVSDTRRYTASFTPSTTPFVNDSNTLLLLHCDGTDGSTFFEDDNGTGRSAVGIKAIGNAQIDTADSKYGGTSLLLDGAGDYLQTAHLSQMAFGTGDFTMEAWINTDVTTSQVIIAGRYGTGGTATENNNVLAIVSGKLSWSNGSAWVIQDASTISTGTWIHVAVVRSSGTVTVYKGGTSIGSTSYTTAITGDRPITIGAFNTGTVNFDGHIDDVRISNTARYTSGFTPSTTPFVNDADTIALYHMNGTDASTVFPDDNGGIPKLRTDSYADYLELCAPLSGYSSIQDLSHYLNTNNSVPSVVASGSNPSLSSEKYWSNYAYSHLFTQGDNALRYTLNNSIPSAASGTFVIEGWFKATASGTQWCLSSEDSGGRWIVSINNETTAFTTSEGNQNFVRIGTDWTHVALVCDGGTKRLYQNGIYKGAWLSSNTGGFSTISVGQFKNGDANDYDGYIQDFRIYIGTNKGYTGTNSSSANFTLPSSIEE